MSNEHDRGQESDKVARRTLTRRDFLRLAGMGATSLTVSAMLQACAAATSAPTAVPATAAPVATTAPVATATAAAAPQTLKVGLIAAGVGDWATTGAMMRQGAEVWADILNARGGIKAGGVNYKIQTMFYDDKDWLPSENLKSLTKAVLEDGVRLIMTTSQTAVLQAIAPFVNQNNVLILTYGAGFALGPNLPNVLGVATLWPQFHPVVLQYWAKRYPNAKKVASVYPDASWASDDQIWFELGAETTGLEIVYGKKADPATVDWYPIMTPVVAAKPDLIYVTTSSGTIPSILETAKALGYKGKWYLDTWYLDQITKKVPADYVEGGIGAKPPPNNPAVVTDLAYQLWKQYTAKYPGDWPSPVNSSVYPMSIFATGAELANSVDPMAIRKALLAADPVKHPFLGDSHWGGKEIYGADNFLMTPSFVGEIQGGQYKVVDVVPFYEWYKKNADIIVKRLKEKGYIK